MKPQCFLLVLTCFTINNVISLKCYVNNMNSLLDDDLPLYELKDCRKIMLALEEDIAKVQFVCFKVVIGSMHELAAKGCMPKGSCAELDAEARKKHPRHRIECYECESEGCNSAPKIKVFTFYAFALAMFAFVL